MSLLAAHLAGSTDSRIGAAQPQEKEFRAAVIASPPPPLPASPLTEPEVSDEDADKLYESGCDDASILTRDGITRLQFDRQASNLDEALASAIQSVERAGITVARVEIERHEVPQIA